MSSKNQILNNKFEKLKAVSDDIAKRFATKVSPDNLCNPQLVLKKISTLKDAKLEKVGSGVYGVVFKGPVGKGKFIIIKTAKRSEDSLRFEYQMMYFLRKKSQFFAPAPYKFAKCDKQIMYYEYANGGDLRTYMDNLFAPEMLRLNKDMSVPLRAVAPIYFKALVTHVLYTLSHICEKLPSFRHNDLHLNNILISKSGKIDGYSKYIFKKLGNFSILKKNLGIQVYIHDFSFSSCNEFPNPEVENGIHIKNYGIGVKSHPLYDTHFFLNCLYVEYEKYPEFAETKAFIHSIFPDSYLGRTSRYIENYRLRYNVKHSLIASNIDKLFMNPYFIKPRKTRTENVIKSILYSVAATSKVLPESIVDFVKTTATSISPVPVKKVVYTMNKDSELKIGTRKCRLYKKPELMKFANTSNKKLTSKILCEMLKKKYINKV
ncbi:hypothetical protein [Dishui Lake phycodnavirus 4]|nr:hypothetical protein [Dishui Lake phycodnavirus 4]